MLIQTSQLFGFVNQVQRHEKYKSSQRKLTTLFSVVPKSNQPTLKVTKESNQLANDSNQVRQSMVTRKLIKKEEDIRNFCSIPRTAQEIMDRLGITNQSKNRMRYITLRHNPDEWND